MLHLPVLLPRYVTPLRVYHKLPVYGYEAEHVRERRYESPRFSNLSAQAPA